MVIVRSNPGIMSAENIVQSDGKCKKCNNKVFGNFVCCLGCKNKYHATGCSNDIDICTPTFLSTFKPFSEKTAPKYAARPGCFHFLCDQCLTTFEKDKCTTRDDKVDDLKAKVDNLENGLRDIKALLLNPNPATIQKQQSTIQGSSSSSHMTAMNEKQVGLPPDNVWGFQNSFAAFGNVELTGVDDFNDSASTNAAIVLPALQDNDEEKSRMKAISKVVMQDKVSISKSYKKKNSETVIVCDSKQIVDNLKQSIKKVAPGIEMKSPNIRKHTIVVVGFDDNCTEDDLVDTLVDQNYFLKAFFATNKVNDHLKLLDIKPLRRDPELFQAILKVSKQLRLLLERKK